MMWDIVYTVLMDIYSLDSKVFGHYTVGVKIMDSLHSVSKR